MIEKWSRIKEKLRDYKLHIILVGSIVLLGFLIAFLSMDKKEVAEELKMYSYENEMEKYLAENVGAYLEQFVLLKDEEKGELADIAVQTYDTILSSGVNEVNEEHSIAIEKRIAEALKNIIADEQITDEDVEFLASGISQLIWNTVKEQLESSNLDNDSQYKEGYQKLYDSLMGEITSLEEKMKQLKISANIKLNSSDEAIENCKAEIYESMEQELSNQEKEILNNIDSELSDMKTKYGNITSGKDGKNGRNGKDGVNGENGKTTYIAYAEDENGTGFSLVPTETTKYIGTCLSELEQAPTEQEAYQNWQPYRSYVMTTSIDEDGTTTLHIN